ncbi:undecaprenyl-diphosphate phosphatase [Breznakia sp. OttesenSCG-928-G09]|nr:undecaprenyl-diphosphate phosphatase [Breznakia sp. OttesenSCG-928-G09]
MIEIIKAIILGIIQGITEWLPISSTGHLILFEQLWSFGDPKFFEVFKVVIQFGSILAVCVLYFKRLNPFLSRKTETEKREIWSLWFKIIIGCIPAGIIGVLFDDVVEDVLSGVLVIAAALIIYGIAFIVLENTKRRVRINRLEQLDYKTAFGIGCFQVLALVPGTSRSGSTILGGSILGCSRTVSSEFSFFLAVPVMAGASLLKVIKFGFNFTFIQIVMLLVGTFVAFVVSIIAIRFLLNYIRKHDFKLFGYYRIILGIIIIAFYLF